MPFASRDLEMKFLKMVSIMVKGSKENINVMTGAKEVIRKAYSSDR